MFRLAWSARAGKVLLALMLAASEPVSCLPPESAAVHAGWSQEQLGNAALIVWVGTQRGVPRRARVVALAAAMQESSLRNLPGGPDDSAGLFQQRPSQGWGTYAQVTDRVYATDSFYSSLLRVRGWQQMSVGGAAQAVQRSAYPDRYGRWVADAERLAGS